MNRRLPDCLIFAIIASVFSLNAISVNGQASYNITHYTNENGLPGNSIINIELDRQNGFLWVGTQAGLVRFDGKQFIGFDAAGVPVASSRVSVVNSNREGTIYCVDDHSRIYRILQNRPVLVAYDTIFNKSLTAARFDEKSARHIAQRLLARKHASFLPDWVIFDKWADTGSFSFIYGGKVCHYAKREGKLHCFPGKPDFRQIFELHNQAYMVSENLELWKYDAKLNDVIPVLIENSPAWFRSRNIKPLIIWKRGMKDPLIVYGRGIWKLTSADKNKVSLLPLCKDCAPADAHIESIQVWEEQQIIFMGSIAYGLYVVHIPFLHALKAGTVTEAGESVYAQAELPKGRIITTPRLSFSADGRQLPDWNGTKYHTYVFYKDRSGDLWTCSRGIGMHKGIPTGTIFHLREKAGTIFHFREKDKQWIEIAADTCATKTIFAETENRLFAISDNAIGEIKEDRYLPLYQLPRSATTKLANVFTPDAAVEWEPGVLAIAQEKLVLFDIHQRMMKTVAIPGLTTKVRALLKYRDYLLIGTYGEGIYIYKNDVVKKMPIDKYKYLSYTHCFMLDNKGFCWISTNRGLFKVSIRSLLTAYDNDLGEIYYHYFGRQDGITYTEFNGGCQPCALKLNNGQYSFPTMNGIVLLNPNGYHVPPPSGQLFVEEIQVGNKSYRPGDRRLNELPSDADEMQIKIALSQFGNAENLYFSYKLEPYNRNWQTQDITRNAVLQFGGLKPGHYKLHLRIRNGYGPYDFGSTVVNFRLKYPWYQQWWFYGACFLSLIFLIWAIVKWRTSRIMRKKKELQQLVDAQTVQLEHQLNILQNQQARLEEDNSIKSRLIAIISHDMISPLKFMNFIGGRLRSSLSSSDPKHEMADTIVTVSQGLESLTLNMLNWIKFRQKDHKINYEYFDLHELVNRSTEIATKLAGEKGVTLFNNIPRGTMVWHYRHALGVIIYNLAVNAAKYTMQGDINIYGGVEGEYFSLEVADTGIGMPEDLLEVLNNPELFLSDSISGEMKFQFGYRIIKDLLRLMQGTMKIESAQHTGTRITICMKQRKE